MDQHINHIPQLVLSHHLHSKKHGQGFFGKLNAFVATLVAKVLSNMYFFWFCLGLDLVELVLGNPKTWSAVTWVTFVSQTVIQLLALPVLGVMGDLQQRASDARAEQDHLTLTALHQINKHQLEILEKLNSGTFQ